MNVVGGKFCILYSLRSSSITLKLIPAGILKFSTSLMKSLDVNHAQAHSKEKSNPTDHKSKGPFVILLSNKQDEDEVAYECRRKGFLVSASMKTKVGRAFLLSLSQKLVVKLAIELNLQVELFHDFSTLRTGREEA